tara:strand:+ start:3218 stop:3433 length:216 start_codon:yes stop_codon:yes gene_type:complete
MEKLDNNEAKAFEKIKNNAKLDAYAQDVIATLHAKYFRHSYYKPCTCSGKTWQQWISQLNDLYDQGHTKSA